MQRSPGFNGIRRRWIVIGLLLAELATACADRTPNKTLGDWGMTIYPDCPAYTSVNQKLESCQYNPVLIYCPAYTSMKLKPGIISWNGLTVGVSTRTEADAILAVEPFVDGIYESIVYQNRSLTGHGEWASVDACYVDDMLVAFSLFSSGATQEFSFDNLIEVYGKPARVAWTGDDYLIRALVWPEQGLMALVEVGISLTQGVFFFPPMSYREFQNTELYKIWPAPYKCEPRVDDFCFADLQLEDPWGIER